MAKKQPDYLSYLLRIWRDVEARSSSATAMWRASLEDPQTGQRRGFANLEELFEFLRKQLSHK